METFLSEKMSRDPNRRNLKKTTLLLALTAVLMTAVSVWYTHRPLRIGASLTGRRDA